MENYYTQDEISEVIGRGHCYVSLLGLKIIDAITITGSCAIEGHFNDVIDLLTSIEGRANYDIADDDFQQLVALLDSIAGRCGCVADETYTFVYGNIITPIIITNTFLGLLDTPNSYFGQANKLVAVASDESGLVFVSDLTFNNAALTGISTAPTAAPGTNTNQIASTAFVQEALSLEDLYFDDVYFSGTGDILTPITLNVDTTPTSGSTNLITSGGVYSFLSSPTNIYNADGALTANRTLTQGTHSLSIGTSGSTGNVSLLTQGTILSKSANGNFFSSITSTSTGNTATLTLGVDDGATDNQSIVLSTGGAFNSIIVTDNSTSSGFIYGGTYTSTDPNWIPPAYWINTQIANAPTIYTQDGTISGDRVITTIHDLTFQMGNNPFKVDTRSTGEGFFASFEQSGGIIQYFTSAGTKGAQVVVSGADLTSSYSFVDISAGNIGSSLQRITSKNSFIGAGKGWLIEDSIDLYGAYYNADYSANFTARSLIDKGYADTTYALGNIYTTNGTLGANRAVALSTHSLSYTSAGHNFLFDSGTGTGSPGGFNISTTGINSNPNLFKVTGYTGAGYSMSFNVTSAAAGLVGLADESFSVGNNSINYVVQSGGTYPYTFNITMQPGSAGGQMSFNGGGNGFNFDLASSQMTDWLTGLPWLKSIAGVASNTYTDATLVFDANGQLAAISSGSGGGGGITTIAIASANGFTSTSSGGSTPTLTIATSITGILKGNGTSISAASAGTDYAAPATTLAGYGITDTYTKTLSDGRYLQLSGGTLTGDVQQSTAPVNSTSLINKGYVDNLIAGLQFIDKAADAASTANVNISSAPASLDGITGASGISRWLLKNQTTASENGIYLFNGTGSALTRTTDATAGTQLVNKTIPVSQGSTQADTWWTITNDTITIGVTSITIVQTAGSGTYTNGTGISLTGNIFSLDVTYITGLLSATSPIFYNSSTGVISSQAATGSQNGYITSTDWNTFNSKQVAISLTTGYIGFSNGTTLIGDANLFWDVTNHRLGIGNTAPTAIFHIAETSTSTVRGAIIDQYSTDTIGTKIYSRKARGTFGSPSTIVTGDIIAAHTFSGYTNAFTDAARILVSSIGTISSGVVPSTMALQTANISGTLTNGILIDQAQLLTFGGYSTVGIAHLSGSGVLTSSLLVNADITAGTIDLTTKVTGVLPSANGGTSFGTYTTGDILYASATNVLSKLAIGATGNPLIVIGGLPAYSNLVLTNPASAATFTLAAGKTFTNNNTLTINSTDGITMTTPTTSFTVARTDAANIFTGIQTMANITNTSTYILNRTGLTTSLSNAIQIYNTSVATVGSQVQNSPLIEFKSNGWNTTPTAANNVMLAGILLEPVAGATVSSNLNMYFNDNGVGYTKRYSFGNTGNLTLLTGNLTLGTAGNRLFITEGLGGMVGQTTLVSGVKTITISGVTTSSRAFVTLVSQGGTSTTVYAYSAVCTANTLTITAETVAGVTVTTDTSIINYVIIN